MGLKGEVIFSTDRSELIAFVEGAPADDNIRHAIDSLLNVTSTVVCIVYRPTLIACMTVYAA